MNSKTPFVLDTAMVVAAGLDDACAAECQRALAPLPMVRVPMGPEVVECLRALRPVLLVLASTTELPRVPTLLDEAAAVGANVVVLADLGAEEPLASALASAVRERRSGGRGSRAT